MPSFIGTSQHSLDEKGRLNLPSKQRDVLTKHYDDRLIVTLSARVTFNEVDRCLQLFPRQEFDLLLEKLKAAPASDPVVAAYKRKVVSNAEECSVDKQGRLLIPPQLRELVTLTEKVVLVGNENALELWSSDAWARAQDVDQILREQHGRLSQFGL